MYEGELVNNEKGGYGKYVYANGTVYEGLWSNNMKNGYGKCTWNNPEDRGHSYDGMW